MTLIDVLINTLIILTVFGSFGFLIWSKLVKRNHPIVAKVYEMLNKPKEKIITLTEQEKWQQPNIDKKIF